jgi:hypothetical protein
MLPIFKLSHHERKANTHHTSLKQRLLSSDIFLDNVEETAKKGVKSCQSRSLHH